MTLPLVALALALGASPAEPLLNPILQQQSDLRLYELYSDRNATVAFDAAGDAVLFRRFENSIFFSRAILGGMETRWRKLVDGVASDPVAIRASNGRVYVFWLSGSYIREVHEVVPSTVSAKAGFSDPSLAVTDPNQTITATFTVGRLSNNYLGILFVAQGGALKFTRGYPSGSGSLVMSLNPYLVTGSVSRASAVQRPDGRLVVVFHDTTGNELWSTVENPAYPTQPFTAFDRIPGSSGRTSIESVGLMADGRIAVAQYCPNAQLALGPCVITETAANSNTWRPSWVQASTSLSQYRSIGVAPGPGGRAQLFFFTLDSFYSAEEQSDGTWLCTNRGAFREVNSLPIPTFVDEDSRIHVFPVAQSTAGLEPGLTLFVQYHLWQRSPQSW